MGRLVDMVTGVADVSQYVTAHAACAAAVSWTDPTGQAFVAIDAVSLTVRKLTASVPTQFAFRAAFADAVPAFRGIVPAHCALSTTSPSAVTTVGDVVRVLSLAVDWAFRRTAAADKLSNAWRRAASRAMVRGAALAEVALADETALRTANYWAIAPLASHAAAVVAWVRRQSVVCGAAFSSIVLDAAVMGDASWRCPDSVTLPVPTHRSAAATACDVVDSWLLNAASRRTDDVIKTRTVIVSFYRKFAAKQVRARIPVLLLLLLCTVCALTLRCPPTWSPFST